MSFAHEVVFSQYIYIYTHTLIKNKKIENPFQNQQKFTKSLEAVVVLAAMVVMAEGRRQVMVAKGVWAW